MVITKELFGQLSQGDVYLFTLQEGESKVQVTNYGATLVGVFVPDKEGQKDDVVLGYGDLHSYVKGQACFGGTVGRYANRIAGATFTLLGKTYRLEPNDKENALHGGGLGFHKRLWTVMEETEKLVLSYESKDGEEGYPGNLFTRVTYQFSQGALRIEYEARTDATTVVSMTSHPYFHLEGSLGGDITGHAVQVNASFFTPVNPDGTVTGEILSTKNTPLDLSVPTLLSERIDSEYEQLRIRGGFDHNYVLSKGKEEPTFAAFVYSEKSGRTLTVYTTKPGLQVYTGNALDGSEQGKRGVWYQKRQGLCLEPQFFPDAVNQNHFPSPLLEKDGVYQHSTVYAFGVME